MSVVVFPFEPKSINDNNLYYELSRINDHFEEFCIKVIGNDKPIKTFASIEKFCKVGTRDKVVKYLMFISEGKCCIIMHYFISDTVRRLSAINNITIGIMEYKGYSIFMIDESKLIDIIIYYLSSFIKSCISKDIYVIKGEDSHLNKINNLLNKHITTVSIINPYSIFNNFNIKIYRRIFVKELNILKDENKNLKLLLEFFELEGKRLEEEAKALEKCKIYNFNIPEIDEFKIDIITLTN